MENLSVISFISKTVNSDKNTQILQSLKSVAGNVSTLSVTDVSSGLGVHLSKTIIFLFDKDSILSTSTRRQAERHLQNDKQCLYFCLIADTINSAQVDTLPTEFLSRFHDLFFWPCSSIELQARIARFKECQSEQQSNQRALLHEFSSLNLIGQSSTFLKTLSLIKKVAHCDAPVLIEGETGTGKENAARAVHYLSSRSDAGFVPINCGALPDDLLESELFGHSKGAFTDAKEKQDGLVAIADGGTLFLDEVDSLSAKAQSALLRFLQTGEYRPLGSKHCLHANVRIIAASNADMQSLVDAGKFREDLLFRLNVLNIDIPPLRERQDDIELLAKSFVQKFSESYQTSKKYLTATSLQWLKQQAWPGNVRELENTLLRYFLLSDDSTIHIGQDNEEPHSTQNSDLDCGSFQAAKAAAIRQFEQSYLQNILRQTGGNVSEAARVSGKERRALGKLLQKYQIEKENFYSTA